MMSVLLSFCIGLAKGTGLLIPPLVIAYTKRRKKQNQEKPPQGQVKGGSQKK